MYVPDELTTARLVLRRWRDADVDAMAAINNDPDVMQHFVAPLTREQTARTIAGYEASFEQCGYLAPAVHLTTKIAVHSWRQHYASEAAYEVLRDGFERVGLARIGAS